MNPQHATPTPGMWFENAGSGNTWHVDAPHIRIATIETPSRHAEANARLIACAPALLAALKALVEVDLLKPEHLAAALRVVAQAEGRLP